MLQWATVDEGPFQEKGSQVFAATRRLRSRLCRGPVIAALLITIVPSGWLLAVDWTNTTGVPDPWYHVGSNWTGGVAPGPNETADFHQAAAYEVWWDGTTALTSRDVKFLNVSAGDVTFLNNGGDSPHYFIINGSGGLGLPSDFSISGANTRLINRGLNLVSFGGAQLLDHATLMLDGSHAQGALLGVEGWFHVDGTFHVDAGAHAILQVANVGTTPTSTGAIRITGGRSRLSPGILRVGQYGNGSLTVEGGGLVSGTNGSIGEELGSTGVATVTGSGSQWNNYQDTVVGRLGNGTLNIEAGGVVSNVTGWMGINGSATGVVTVTGMGSQWNNSRDLEVGGWSGHGMLHVEAGGVVNSGFSNIALFGTGVATVTGAGSQWNNASHLSVGRYSHGTLNVEAGGAVHSSRGFIGRNSYGQSIGDTVGTGVARVTGAGSEWRISSSLSVGSGGHATLSVEAGGVVSNTQGYIAESPVPFAPDSMAVATVVGSGSQWNNSLGLSLGGTESSAGALGTLNVIDHGLVNVGTTFKIWGTGTLNLDGGTIQVGTIDHTHGGAFDFLDGTLDVGIFNGNLVQDGGTLVIGRSSGITQVAGNYDQIMGGIEIEVFSSASVSTIAGTDFDQLTADSVTLSGRLDLVVDPGYSPSLGDSLTIIHTTNGVSGEFRTVNPVELPGGLAWEVVYGTHDVMLEVVPEPGGIALMGVALLVASHVGRYASGSSLDRRGTPGGVTR